MATESLQESMNDFNNEVAFLRFFYERAGEMMGPADCEIYRMIADDFVAEGGALPASYRDGLGFDEEEADGDES